MKLLYFYSNASFAFVLNSKRLNLFFFMIIIVLFLGFERFADSIILSKNECIISKNMIKPEIEFHRERVVFSLLISQTVLACQHETFELIHEALP